MSIKLRPGQGVLYMKIGNHAQEPLASIIERKRREIERAGFGLWGYGGNTCHPETMVQPFARTYEERSGVIYLCMQPMDSKHFAEPIRAEEYSVDGVTWKKVHPRISVVGSRYALVIRNLREDKFDLPLANTKVALGNSMGVYGSRYVSGRIDKACLEVTEEEDANADPSSLVRIELVAEIVSPYAVYVRN